MYVHNMSFFSLSQVQKHKTISVMWPNERMRLNSNFSFKILFWCGVWSDSLGFCCSADIRRDDVSYTLGLVQDQLISKRITYPFFWRQQSQQTFRSLSRLEFETVWITGTTLPPLNTLATFLLEWPKLEVNQYEFALLK